MKPWRIILLWVLTLYSRWMGRVFFGFNLLLALLVCVWGQKQQLIVFSLNAHQQVACFICVKPEEWEFPSWRAGVQCCRLNTPWQLRAAFMKRGCHLACGQLLPHGKIANVMQYIAKCALTLCSVGHVSRSYRVIWSVTDVLNLVRLFL